MCYSILVVTSNLLHHHQCGTWEHTTSLDVMYPPLVDLLVFVIVYVTVFQSSASRRRLAALLIALTLARAIASFGSRPFLGVVVILRRERLVDTPFLCLCSCWVRVDSWTAHVEWPSSSFHRTWSLVTVWSPLSLLVTLSPPCCGSFESCMCWFVSDMTTGGVEPPATLFGWHCPKNIVT